ncbi:DUF4817 domain-containing protein [Trichonephila clavipes]|uniref:DUF4817 domain-containing protein n=1 Tax=Trichonephila clavipes TaxID=2585209 RepID=A0A8X7BEC5_TRICX|nr:DUF4817 domain-containing protein [Trichonephila clavipes]
MLVKSLEAQNRTLAWCALSWRMGTKTDVVLLTKWRMTHTSNERATETVLFAGMCAKCMPKPLHFLTDQRASKKMTTSKQKVFCVPRLTKTESAITVQRTFRIKFGCQPPTDNNILR